jgi:hypothetical protein
MSFDQARDGWHRIAEHVVAAAQYADTGEIALRAVSGGFQTTSGPRQLSVIGTDLVIADGNGTRTAPLTTVAAAAEFVGIVPGLPVSVYPPATPLEPDEPLHLDEASARILADWYQLGDEALRRLASEVGSTQVPILWPEHFDIGITLDMVNFGASPGDDHIAQPYLYVGPHTGPPRRDDFWNTAFGAARTVEQIPNVEEAFAFFREGRRRLTEPIESRRSPSPDIRPRALKDSM